MIKKSIIKTLQNGTLIVCSVIFSLVIAELALQLTNLGRYSLYKRALFFTQPSLVLKIDKTVRYKPQEKIRIVSVYGDQIDYDISYQTNNLGFIDDVNYTMSPPKTKTIAFVGDSFTSGDGGDQPWISQLRRRMKQPELALYNFGVTGTGVLHFQGLLASLKNSIVFDEINIMVISNDFFRRLWYPFVYGNAMWFCHNETKEECFKNKSPVIHIAGHNDSQDQLLERAKKIYAMDSNTSKGYSNFFQQLRLYTLICDAYSLKAEPESLQNSCPHLKVYQTKEYKEYEKNKIYQKSLVALQKIKENFPGVFIRVLHIPEKGETFNNKYSINLKKDMEKIGLDYIPLLEVCDWKRRMYHKHDGHLNNSGYANLVDCILKTALNAPNRRR